MGNLPATHGTTIGLDWMRWSGPVEHLKTVLRFCREHFGLLQAEWSEGPGLWFYKNSYRHPLGLNLCYTELQGQTNCEHCTIEIPGSAFNTLGMDKILCFNTELHRCGFRATRVDVRMDWHGESLTIIDDITDACRRDELANLRTWQPMEKWGGKTRTAFGCNLGQRESPLFYRAYDKGLEQGDQPEGRWVRLELELKGDRAAAFAKELASLSGSGYFEWDKLCAGVLFGHVDFREGKRNQRISTRRQSGFWRELMKDIEVVTYMPERTKSSMDKHWAWLGRAVLPMMASLMQHGDLDVEQLWELLAVGVDPYTDAMLRPVIYQYVRHFKMGQLEGPIEWDEGRAA